MSSIKILLCNIALRRSYDPFPPVACTSICNTLKREGYSPSFYDIDAHRPSFEELYDYFVKEQFDIVGISAVSSTGYDYTKRLSQTIKKASAKTQVVLGGNLASSCGILLRKCPIDICVIGEGEKVMINLVRYWEKHENFKPENNDLIDIKSIAFLNTDGNCIITPMEKPLRADEIEQPDYEMIAAYSNIDKYLLDPMTRADFAIDPRSFEPHRKNQKMAEIVTSKGCINRCTFCHRWINGYKLVPVEKIVKHITFLKTRYNVGFFVINVECFGEDSQWLEQFIAQVKPLDVLFMVGGARVSIVKKDKSIIKKLKDAGMTALYFGVESGCSKILKVMDKHATVDDNKEALRICAEAGVFTTIQLVIGMPGENGSTIQETISFVNEATGDLPYPPSLSVTYLQSLPGTPTYEFLRIHGMLGKTMEEEEEYLIKVSNINAADFRHYINVSEEPMSIVKSWSRRIYVSAHLNWQQKQNRTRSVSHKKLEKKINMVDRIYGVLIYVLGDSFWKMIVIKNRVLLYGWFKALMFTFGIRLEDNRTTYKIGAVSLREILHLEKTDNIAHTDGLIIQK